MPKILVLTCEPCIFSLQLICTLPLNGQTKVTHGALIAAVTSESAKMLLRTDDPAEVRFDLGENFHQPTGYPISHGGTRLQFLRDYSSDRTLPGHKNSIRGYKAMFPLYPPTSGKKISLTKK